MAFRGDRIGDKTKARQEKGVKKQDKARGGGMVKRWHFT
jgi:hypothetical protein